MIILKKLGLGLLGLIGLILIAALFVSKDFNYEKTITIDAPIDRVWENVNSLGDLEKWSPWAAYDPNMKKEITGTDGTIGAKNTWDSQVENVGAGSQEIVEIKAPTLFKTKLVFTKPFENEADGFVKLSPNGNKTDVSWSFESEMKYPFNIMKIFMNMEKSIGKDFSLGLSKLKKICEG